MGISNELQTMWQRDRGLWSQIIDSHLVGTSEGKRLLKQFDDEIVPRLQAIFDEHRWPGEELIGKEGAEALFNLVLHRNQRVDFQEMCLGLIQSSVEKAYLTDRVRVNQGKGQVYGTQYLILQGGIVIQSVEDPENLNTRRKAIGLPPIEEVRYF